MKTKLEAGPELDALVAVEVMEVRAFPPNYSTDIGAAWQVVEKLRAGKFVWIKDCGGFGWRVEILSSSETDIQIDFSVVADTAPLAICLAALKVMEAKR